MARTTTDRVEKLLTSRNWDTGIETNTFIEMATAVVSRVSTLATSNDITYTSTELELMERYLAAHFYCTADPLPKSESQSTGKGAAASATYYDRSFLEDAKMLDHGGVLQAVLEHKVASATWLGKPVSGQTLYVDRD